MRANSIQKNAYAVPFARGELRRSGGFAKDTTPLASFFGRIAELRPGTMLTREWNGEMQRVAVLEGGFAWGARPIRASPVSCSPSRGRAGTGQESSGFEIGRRQVRHHEDPPIEAGSMRDLHARLDRSRSSLSNW